MSKTCYWYYDAAFDVWNTDCGNAYQFVNPESPEGNGFDFCPYCGYELNCENVFMGGPISPKEEDK